MFQTSDFRLQTSDFGRNREQVNRLSRCSFHLLTLLFSVLFACIYSTSIAQANAWITGNEYTVFSSTGTVSQALPQPGGAGNYAGQVAEFNQYIEFSLETGILFFIIDSNVYDRDGFLIADNDQSAGCQVCLPISRANVTTAVYSESCDKFWLFFANNVTLLDLSLPNPIHPSRKGYVLDWDISMHPFDTYLNGDLLNFANPNLNPVASPPAGTLNERPYLILPVANSGGHAIEGILIDVFDDNFSGPKYIAIQSENEPYIYRIDHTGVWLHQQWGNTTYSPGDGLPFYNSIELTKNSSGNILLAASISAAGTMTNPQENLFLFEANQNFVLQNVTSLNAHIGGVGGSIGDLVFSPNADYIYFGLEQPPYFGYYRISTNSFGDLSSVMTTTEAQEAGKSQLEINNFNGNPVLMFAGPNGVSYITSPDDPTQSQLVANAIPNANLAQHNSAVPFADFFLLQHQQFEHTYNEVQVVADCCAFNAEQVGETNHKIQGTSTWSPGTSPFEEQGGVVYFPETIVFESGSNITINDLEFRFGPNAHVVIEAGARVEINNCVWTASCDEMWPGVDVLGTTNALHSIPQIPISAGNQGYFIANHSMIEYAVNGIEVGTSINTGGGIIRADNLTFRNCLNGVHFREYRFKNAAGDYVQNLSRFRECLFITDHNYRVVPYFHVQLNRVDWVKFIDCSFVNSNNDNVPWYNRGSGIRAFRASFLVDGSNEPWIPAPMPQHPTAFHKLRYGIYSAALSDQLTTYTCRQMEFQLCLYGIVNIATDNIMVHENNFLIANLPGLNGIDITGNTFGTVERGIYISNSTAYTIEQNTFVGFDNFMNPDPFPNAVGVWVNESGFEANEVRNNDFAEMKMGILVTRNNTSDRMTQEGLQLLCNTFAADEVDIYVGEESRMRWVQGGVQSSSSNPIPAGNVFSSPTCGGVSSDFIVNPNNIFWYNYICNQGPLTEPDCQSFSNVPGYVGQPLLIVSPDFSPISPSDCPDRFGPGTGGPSPLMLNELYAQFSVVQSELESAINNYELVVDANQKENTIAILNEAFPQESQFYRDLLLQRQPLSDEVLREVIQRAERLNDWHLTQVFLSNSPLRKDILTEIENSEILSSFFMDFLHNADYGQSLRTLMEYNIMSKATARDNLLKEIYSAGIHYDVDGAESEELIPLYSSEFFNALGMIGGERVAVKQAGQLARDGDYSAAVALLSEFNNYQTLRTIYEIEAELEAHDWANATSTQWQVIRSIYDDESNRYSPIAASLLFTHDQFTVEPEPELPIQLKSLSSKSTTPAKKESLLGVWPNPANEQAWLHYPREVDESDDALISVFDSNGKLALQFKPNNHGLANIDLQHFPPGLYLIQLSAFGRVIETIKLTVQR